MSDFVLKFPLKISFVQGGWAFLTSEGGWGLMWRRPAAIVLEGSFSKS